MRIVSAIAWETGGATAVKRLSTFGYWKLILLSKPEPDRLLYRIANRELPLHIAEFGLDTGARAEHLIQVVQRRTDPSVAIRYTGIDLFEGRAAAEAKLPLIEAHRRLTRTGVKVRLLPGDFATSIQRLANQLQGVDLLVITARERLADLSGCWFYVPRILSERASIFLKCLGDNDESFLRISRSEVEKLAQRSGPGQTRRVA